MNYHPSAAARSLASGKTRVIGLVVDSLTDTFLSAAIGGINDYLENNEYFLGISGGNPPYFNGEIKAWFQHET